MPPQFGVLIGPAQSGKTEQLLDGYRDALAAGEPGSTLWLAPTHRAAADIRGRIVGVQLAGCFGPGVTTFDHFADSIVAFAELPVRPITAWMKRQIIRDLVSHAASSARLPHFAPIAETEGLIDILDAFITELKRLEIWPEHFADACEARGQTAKDADLLTVYAAYQKALNDHQLYDAEGRFWSARALLREGQIRPHERLRYVVVDGFTDFTRTQHEILALLAQRVDHLHVSLPCDEGPGRAELFAKSLATLAELDRRLPRLARHSLSRPATLPCPALRHIEMEIFKNPREQRTADETAGIVIAGCAGEVGEIEWLARTIKSLLHTGDHWSGAKQVKPSDIVVVFRSLAEIAPTVREVFGRLGLPYAIEARLSLDRCPVLAALVALLRLDRENWPFRQVLAALANNLLAAESDNADVMRGRAAAERMVRMLQIPTGRAELVREIEAWATRPDPPPDEEDDAETLVGASERKARVNKRRQDARLAHGVVSRLAALIEMLPTSVGAPMRGPRAWQIWRSRPLGRAHGQRRRIPPMRWAGRSCWSHWPTNHAWPRRLDVDPRRCARVSNFWIGSCN